MTECDLGTGKLMLYFGGADDFRHSGVELVSSVLVRMISDRYD